MRVRFVPLFMAALFAAAVLVTVGAWRRHGRHELARLASEARAELRDALKAEKEVVRGYVYDAWPYWWGAPRYGWWEERTTVIYAPPPASRPAPAPAPRRRVEVVASPEANVEIPQAPAPPPAPKARRVLPPL